MVVGKHAAPNQRRSPVRWFLDLSWLGKAVGVVGATVAAVVGAVVGVELSAATSPAYTAAGTIRCLSGATVVAAQILSSEGDNARVDLQPVGGATEVVGPVASFSYRLTNGGSYRLHVGCGGNAGHWATANYSVSLRGAHEAVVCQDPRPISGMTPHGTCHLAH
jgi:hypothetical protein